MLDQAATHLIRPFISRLARLAFRFGLSANKLTIVGCFVGCMAACAITMAWFFTGLVLILLSRLCDGLDGAVARLTESTDRGGFLDICLDFVFYAAIPLAFAIQNPTANAVPAALLLACFILTATSFLAFASLAAKRGMSSTAYPNKSFYFLGGLTEATETLIFFCAMCIWPHYFAWLAYIFASLCLMTFGYRIAWGWKNLG